MNLDDETDALPSTSQQDSFEGEEDQERIRISRLVSLFLLSQVFLIVSYEPLVQRLVKVIQTGSMSLFAQPWFLPPPETLEESLIQVHAKCGCDDNNSSPNRSRESEDIRSNISSSQDGSFTSQGESSANNSFTCLNTSQSSPARTSVISNSVEPHDPSDINEASITDEEKVTNLVKRFSLREKSPANSLPSNERPFRSALFTCLDCSDSKDDHTFIFALCLIYAIVHNKGMKRICSLFFIISLFISCSN